MFGSGGSADQVIQWTANPMAVDRRWKANIEVAPNCPRCASANTKFCYYNNYSLSQPRYFCKGCRRYWTKGGSLRNVPIGGGCRKSRRAKSTKAQQSTPPPSSASPSSSSAYQKQDSDKSSSNDSNEVDIDMAAVFARFLNQGLGPGVNADDGVNSMESQPRSGGSAHDFQSIQSQPQQRLPDPGITPQIIQGQDRLHEGIDIGTRDCVAYTFDQVVQGDEFWPDVSNFNNSWQPLAELQELDDQFKNSTNSSLYGDNWSSLDIMSYDAFPRSSQF